MAGLDIAASAIGIASFGIQVCQGLLTFYDHWRNYHNDMKLTCDILQDLENIFIRLDQIIKDPSLDSNSVTPVRDGLIRCRASLVQLEKRLHKLQIKEKPRDIRQKAFAELQRFYYPLKASTLAKVKENVGEVRENLALALQTLSLDVSLQSQVQLEAITSETKKIGTKISTIERDSILAWLAAPDPSTNHDEARKRCQVGTGGWLHESPVYQNWKTSSNSMLWLNGKVGCGKSILCSTIIEDLLAETQDTGDTQVLYFYFSFSDQQKQSQASLYSSLVAQLANTDEGLERLIQERRRAGPGQPSIQLLTNILQSELNGEGHKILVLDALDEVPDIYDERSNIMQWLGRIINSGSSIKALVTSRSLLEIEQIMNEIGAHVLSIDNAVVNADIRLYVKEMLERYPRLRSLPTTLKIMIEQTLEDKADGMFRWAFCQLQNLKNLKSMKPKFVKEQLSRLPKDLDETYARMLEDIGDDYFFMAKAALRWLTFETRPLTLAELNEACLIDLDRGIVDFDNRGDVGDTTVDSTSRIRLAHFSVKEYLLSRSSSHGFHLTKQEALWTLGQSCALYIKRYSESEVKTLTNHDCEAFPFLEYSSYEWFEYLRDPECRGDLLHDLDLLMSESYRKDWLMIYNPDDQRSLHFEPSALIYTDLYCATILRLVALSKKLIENGSEINAKGGNLGYPLTAAAYHRDRETVNLLLDQGADVNAEGGTYSYALIAAAYSGNHEIVKLLLSRGADINAQGPYFGYALTAAAHHGDHETIRLLLDRGADIRAEGGRFDYALTAAAFSGNQETVELLLDQGADINAKGAAYGYALTAAAFSGSRETVELLLGRGADMNAQGCNEGDALTAAAFCGYDEIIKLLLNRGADINAQESTYGYALTAAAACSGDRETIKLLLDHGANVNAEGGEFGYALTAAAYRGHPDILELLLNQGADINAEGGHYGYALIAAAYCEHPEAVELLLNRGADVNARGHHYGHALSAAIRWRHQEIVKLLLDRGADVNAKSGNMDSALLTVLTEEIGLPRGTPNKELVALLLDHGANMEMRNQQGNALELAAQIGRTDIVQLLIEYGADVLARGDGPTALELAEVNGHTETTEVLTKAINDRRRSNGGADLVAKMSGGEVKLDAEAIPGISTTDDNSSDGVTPAQTLESSREKLVR